MFNKPLFSRRQLHIIIAVTAVAIVLLSASGMRPTLPTLTYQQLDNIPVYAVESEDDRQLLSLSFALPQGMTAEHADLQLTQRLLLESLATLKTHSAFIQQPAQIELRSQIDRLQLILTLTEPTANLTPLLVSLFQDGFRSTNADQWLAKRQLLQAENYLNQQVIDPGLQQLQKWMHNSDFQATASYGHWQTFQQQLFSQAQLRIALQSPDIERSLAQVEEALPSLAAGTLWPVRPLMQHARQHQIGTSPVDYQLWMGRTMAGRNTDDFVIEMLAVRQLQELARSLNIGIHWIPQRAAADLLLRLRTADDITPERVIERLEQRLRQTDDSVLESNRQKMIDSLYQNSQNSSLFFDQLESIAFYQLPADYLAQTAKRLQQLTPTILRQRIKALLEFRQYHWILLRPKE